MLKIIVFIALISGCASVDKPSKPIVINSYLDSSEIQNTKIWHEVLDDQNLKQILNKALISSPNLKQSELDAKIQVSIAKQISSSRWPDVKAYLNSDFIKSDTSDTSFTSSGLRLNYDIDYLLSASDNAKSQAVLAKSYTMLYQNERIKLVNSIIKSYFNLITLNKKIALSAKDIDSRHRNLKIVESNYLQGISGALDLYLARGSFHSASNRLIAYKKAYHEQYLALNTLIGNPPNAQIKLKQNLPVLEEFVYQIDNRFLQRRYDVSSAMLKLDSANLKASYAYKKRYPSLSLDLSLDFTSDDISALFDPSSMAWRAFFSATAPIFNAGKLKSIEEQERLKAQKAAQNLYAVSLNAYLDIEKLTYNEKLLKDQEEHQIKASENYTEAYILSLDRYSQGLIEYINVIDAEIRAIEFQIEALNVKNERLSNRIDLYTALGDMPINSEIFP